MTEETLFEQARMFPADKRDAFLARECAGQPELRARIEALLAADAASQVPLDRPAVVHDQTGEYTPQPDDLPAPARQSPPEPRVPSQAGTVIAGRYSLVERIGEGGMGEVWVARQTEPVKRKVAIKLIKAGMDSRQVLVRFEAERQALALMDHPNIAKVLDGGLHEQRPFFVMELVKGVPITEYCDANKLTPKERLELFVQACQAIQHAHQKGIIHRDIKPTNVLVALYDDRLIVKVIDFGVAKATGGTLTEATLDTAFGGVVGTPQYMSPEQAMFNNLDIDTRSDVYALGVLLYELLTGSTPFSSEELKKKGFLEILRVVREEEPPRPSTKLSTADALPTLSAKRGTEPSKLTGLLRHELDWIVMKALEKDRTRRYETANGFAADVLRFLAGEPVQAHPPSKAYRVKKFVRRNRPQVIAASLVLLALVAGVLGTTIGMLEARRQTGIAKQEADAKEAARAEEAKQRAIAETNERKAVAAAEQERLAKAQIALQLKQIELVNDSVFDIFGEFDIREMRAGSEPLQAVLAKRLIETGRSLDEKAISDPLVLAKIRNRLGLTLISLGYPQDAIKLFVEVLAIWSEKFGPDHPDTLTCMSNLAQSYQHAGKLDQALPLQEKTLGLRKAKLGADHPDTISSMSNLAEGYRAIGKLDQALPLLEEALKLMKAKLGADHPDTILGMNNLAGGYQNLGQMDKALPLFLETLKLRRAKLGPDHPDSITAINNLATIYLQTGKLDKALPLFEESHKRLKAKIGSDHPDTLTVMSNLAECYRYVKRLDKALPLYEETLKLKKARLGPDHPDTFVSMNNLALGYQAAGQHDRALPLFAEALGLMKAKLGSDHPNTLTCMNNVAECHMRAGKFDLALPLFEEALKRSIATLGPDHPDTIAVYGALGGAYCDVKQGEKAAATLTAFVAGQRKQLSNAQPHFAGLLTQVAEDLAKCGQFAVADEMFREVLAIREKTQPDEWRTFDAKSLVGGTLLRQKKYADAEPLLLQGYEGMKVHEKSAAPPGRQRVFEALDRLIELYTATNKPDEVKKWQAERARYTELKKQPEKKENKK